MNAGAWGSATWNALPWDGATSGGVIVVPVGRTTFASTGQARGVDPERSSGRLAGSAANRAVDARQSTGKGS